MLLGCEPQPLVDEAAAAAAAAAADEEELPGGPEPHAEPGVVVGGTVGVGWGALCALPCDVFCCWLLLPHPPPPPPLPLPLAPLNAALLLPVELAGLPPLLEIRV